MTKHSSESVVLIFLSVLFLGACAPTEQPQQAIIDYLNARILGDEGVMRQLVCAGWESQVMLEANSFRGRSARLDDVTCTVVQQSDASGIVACDGQIIVVYDGEDTAFEIGNYNIVHEDGAWKMCGEAQ